MPFFLDKSRGIVQEVKDPSLNPSLVAGLTPVQGETLAEAQESVFGTEEAPTGAGFQLDEEGINVFQGGPSVISSIGGKETIDDIKDNIGIDQPEGESEPTPTPTIEEQLLLDESESAKTDVQREFESKERFISDTLDPLKAQLDISKQRQIDNIKSQFSQLKRKQEESNTRRVRLQETIGIRFGGRFVLDSAADLVQEQVSIGVQEIADITRKEAAAISDINNAFDNKQFDLAVDKFNEVKKLRAERTKKFDEIEKAQLEGLKSIQQEDLALTTDLAIAEAFNISKDPGDIQRMLAAAGHKISLDQIADALKILDISEEENFVGTSSDFRTFKQFFPDTDLSTPEGLKKFLEFQASVSAAGRKPGEGDGGGGGEEPGGISDTTKNVIDGVQDIEDLTPSEQQKTRDELRQIGLFEDQAPEWFTELLEGTRAQSLLPEEIQETWAQVSPVAQQHPDKIPQIIKAIDEGHLPGEILAFLSSDE